MRYREIQYACNEILVNSKKYQRLLDNGQIFVYNIMLRISHLILTETELDYVTDVP